MTTRSSISTVYTYNIIIQLFGIFQPFASQEICQGFVCVPTERGDDDVCAFSLARRRHIDAVDGFVSFRFVDDEGPFEG